MSPIELFLWGVFGSVIVEVAVAGTNYYAPKPHGWPWRYKRRGFYVWRAILALIGGGLALLYGVDNRVLAVNIGAAAPAILKSFTEGIKGR